MTCRGALARAAAVAAVAAVAAAPLPASAYTIGSAFSDPCHEDMTLAAAVPALDAASFRPADEVPVPSGGIWKGVTEAALEGVELVAKDDAERFLLASLLLGARFPDTEGLSITNPQAARLAHAEPEDQYEHCLRRPQDNGPKGDVAALAGTRAVILAQLEKAEAQAAQPAAEQVILTTVVLDFYGPVEVEVWAPAFSLGQALHAFEDCFSHTIRTDDLRRVRHVMNFIEAITSDHQEAEDGLAHSGALDACRDEGKEIAGVATEATAELAAAFLARLGGAGGAAVEATLDTWLQYEQGCTLANDYCGSPWMDVARTDPAEPLSDSILGCAAAPEAGGWLAGLLVLGLPLFALRRRSG